MWGGRLRLTPSRIPVRGCGSEACGMSGAAGPGGGPG